jgi:hypothetical protein
VALEVFKEGCICEHAQISKPLTEVCLDEAISGEIADQEKVLDGLLVTTHPSAAV